MTWWDVGSAGGGGDWIRLQNLVEPTVSVLFSSNPWKSLSPIAKRVGEMTSECMVIVVMPLHW